MQKAINLRYLRLKMLKNKQNNNKIYDIFYHNFKNIPCYVTSEVSLKRFYFALSDDGLTFKTLKLAYISFCIQTLHIFYCTARAPDTCMLHNHLEQLQEKMCFQF